MNGLRDDLVAKLEEENDFLRERVRQLEEHLLSIDEKLIPVEWALTGRESKVFRALVSREFATKEFIMEFLYSDRPNDLPEMKIVDVFICKMRAKLKPYSVKIHTVWGSGYRVDPEIRAQFNRRLGESATNAA